MASIGAHPLPAAALPPERVARWSTPSPLDLRRLARLQARWRGRKARRLYKSILKRAFIVREIWQTEKAYVESLRFMHEAYELPLRERASKGNALVPDKYLDSIFFEIDALLACNRLLLERLDARISAWNVDSVIGDIFVDISKSFELYTSFVNNFDRANHYARKLMNNNEGFQKFVAQLDATARNKLRLNDFLIMPIQRIPRYELLLGQMLAATAPTHADHALLKEAVREIKRVADFVNEKKREVEARARVGEIQTKMAGDYPTLVTETRRLIRDADVVALSGSDRSDRGDRSDRELRHLFLFNDAILCVTFVESQTTLTKVFTGKVEYNFHWLVPIMSVRVDADERPVKGRNYKEPEKIMKEIQRIERQIGIERSIEKSAAKIAKIYKAEHDKAHKRDAKQAVGETESKIEQLEKELKHQQNLMRLFEPTFGLTLRSDSDSISATFIVRSANQRAEWINEIHALRELHRKSSADSDASSIASQTAKARKSGFSFRALVHETTTSITNTLGRRTAGKPAGARPSTVSEPLTESTTSLSSVADGRTATAPNNLQRPSTAAAQPAAPPAAETEVRDRRSSSVGSSRPIAAPEPTLRTAISGPIPPATQAAAGAAAAVSVRPGARLTGIEAIPAVPVPPSSAARGSFGPRIATAPPLGAAAAAASAAAAAPSASAGTGASALPPAVSVVAAAAAATSLAVPPAAVPPFDAATAAVPTIVEPKAWSAPAEEPSAPAADSPTPSPETPAMRDAPAPDADPAEGMRSLGSAEAPRKSIDSLDAMAITPDTPAAMSPDLPPARADDVSADPSLTTVSMSISTTFGASPRATMAADSASPQSSIDQPMDGVAALTPAPNTEAPPETPEPSAAAAAAAAAATASAAVTASATAANSSDHAGAAAGAAAGSAAAGSVLSPELVPAIASGFSDMDRHEFVVFQFGQRVWCDVCEDLIARSETTAVKCANCSFRCHAACAANATAACTHMVDVLVDGLLSDLFLSA